jgi:hypothetical protein
MPRRKDGCQRCQRNPKITPKTNQNNIKIQKQTKTNINSINLMKKNVVSEQRKNSNMIKKIKKRRCPYKDALKPGSQNTCVLVWENCFTPCLKQSSAGVYFQKNSIN